MPKVMPVEHGGTRIKIEMSDTIYIGSIMIATV